MTRTTLGWCDDQFEFEFALDLLLAGLERLRGRPVASKTRVPNGASTEGGRVRYLVIETYTQGPGPVYARFAERGRMLPPGLVYLDSWIDERGLDRCFQLMETEDPALFSQWTANWQDLTEFEVVPVISSAEAAARSTR
jgi:Domain of unknown function (DUF3303)